MNIPLTHIRPNPKQPRLVFDPAELADLAASIQERGVVQPITVEPDGEDGYFIRDGERRWRASQMVGMETIFAAIVPAANGQGDKLRLLDALIANLHRSDLNVVDAGLAYRELRDVHGMTTRQIAKALGKQGAGGEAHVALRLKIVDQLDAPIQTLIAEGRLFYDHRVLDALLTIQDPATRVQMAQRLADKRFTIKGCLAAIRRFHEHVAAHPLTPGEAPALQLADRKSPPAGEPPQWNALAQLGHVPLWKNVERSVRATCRGCALAEIASEVVCRECPVIVLLIQLKAGGYARKEQG